MKFRNMLVLLLALLLSFSAAVPLLNAQTLTQGDILGTVTDPSGAVIPGATVTIKSNRTGAEQTRTTSSTGAYRFSLLSPGDYTVTFSASNYKTIAQTVTVALGQSSTANVRLALAAAQETVTVTAEAGVLQTNNPNLATTMSSEIIHLTPNGGGDLSYMAQTAPGSSMNVQAGYGNFSNFGIAATSNNFTYNSMPENDPFLSLNNSGATNILLGQNDISETTIVSNGYTGQYSMNGANVNYVSKSGTNAYHGNAQWLWNGRYVNANNYFNNADGTPRPFVNDNQWAASFGGPIHKDSMFFFANTEGLRVIIPVVTPVTIPTPAFQQAVLSNIAAVSPSQVSLYQNMFKLWNNAPGASRASSAGLANGGCGDLSGFGSFGAGNPCAALFSSSQGALTHEYLITGRWDYNINTNNRVFAHVRTDQGVQATYVDPINSAFNLTSDQPQWEGQFQWVRTLSANTVNSFSINGSYYRAIFAQTNPTAALALQPFEISFSGGPTTGLFYPLGFNYTTPHPTPQGRNVTQYGFVEDLSHTMGKHTLKFGGDLARYDISDYGIGSGSLPLVNSETMTDFVAGNATTFIQSFPNTTHVPINMYRLGMYVSDQWRVKQNLQLTLTLRADRNSNPNCVTNCLSRFTTSFNNLNANLNTPYNQSITVGGQSLPNSFNPWSVQPRFGFNWSPFGANGNTVISGGIGIFADVVPAVFIDAMLPNLPNDPTILNSGLSLSASGAAALAAANALKTGFAQGATFGTLNSTLLAAGVPSGFTPPNFFNPGANISVPQAQKWNLQVQHAIGTKMALSLNYVGNHAIHEQINNNGLNAYCGATVAVTAPAGTPSCFSALGITSFAGMPASPFDPRFLQVTELTTGYNSNYNGLTVSFLRRLSAFQFQLNYTYSHALDDLSNNGVPFTPFNFNTNTSVTNPNNPFNVTQNMYGNSDYDMRHMVTMNYVWDTPKNILQNSKLNSIFAGWTIGGTLFWHTGTPFTVADGSTAAVLNAYGYGGAGGIVSLFNFANNTNGVGTLSCSATFNTATTSGPCPGLTNNFIPSVDTFGNVRRNQVYGPKFFNTDLTITKNFHIPGREGMTLSVGATAYNLFNHPNFDQPVQNVASSAFGLVQHTVSVPTSIYGSFLGADASPRLLQSRIALNF